MRPDRLIPWLYTDAFLWKVGWWKLNLPYLIEARYLKKMSSDSYILFWSLCLKSFYWNMVCDMEYIAMLVRSVLKGSQVCRKIKFANWWCTYNSSFYTWNNFIVNINDIKFRNQLIIWYKRGPSVMHWASTESLLPSVNKLRFNCTYLI